MLNRIPALLTVISAASLIWSGSCLAKSYSVGIDTASDYAESQIVAKQIPVIPAGLHEQCFKSCCIARFQIGADGKTKVKLLSSSGCEEIDDLTLSTLKKWKFRPAMLDGQPVPSTRKVKVEFEID